MVRRLRLVSWAAAVGLAVHCGPGPDLVLIMGGLGAVLGLLGTVSDRSGAWDKIAIAAGVAIGLVFARELHRAHEAERQMDGKRDWR